LLRVKICGNRTPEEVSLAVSLGADAVGLIVGVRHKSEDALTPERAAHMLALIPVFVSSVLVTHLVSAEEVLALYDKVPTSTIQLHDAISEAEIEAIRRRLPWVRLIKAVGVKDGSAIDVARRFEPLVDAILVDTHTSDRIGGTGITHDWSISRDIVRAVRCPVILAGGLTPENLANAVALVRPYGVDVNSGVEFPNGDKDPDREKAFIDLAKSSLAP